MRKSQEYFCLFSSSISFILSSLLTAPLTFVSLLTELYQRATFANDSDSGHRRHHKGVHAIYRKSLKNCVTKNVALLPALPPECKEGGRQRTCSVQNKPRRGSRQGFRKQHSH